MAFSSLTMKIESTAPTAAAVSSAQPAVRLAASNHSPWRSRAPHHPTLHQPLSTFPHPRVSGLSPQCFHFVFHSPNPPVSPSLTLSLSPMCFPFGQQGSTGQGGQGESQAVARSWLRQPDRACSGFQWAMQTCSNMQQHAALGCCMHNQSDLKAYMGAFIEKWRHFCHLFPSKL